MRTVCGVLHTTGCRLSEALARTPERIDRVGRARVFKTLKKRRCGTRQVDDPLWPWSRMTAWRPITAVLPAAGISESPHRSPKERRTLGVPGQRLSASPPT